MFDKVPESEGGPAFKESEEQNVSQTEDDINIKKDEDPSCDANEEEDMRGLRGEDLNFIGSLLENLSEEEQHRYEAFRRAHLAKSTVKRLVQSILLHSVAGGSVIVIQGAGKLFVGEIVKLALEVMEEFGDVGPIRPCHIREAFHRLKYKPGIYRSPFLGRETIL